MTHFHPRRRARTADTRIAAVDISHGGLPSRCRRRPLCFSVELALPHFHGVFEDGKDQDTRLLLNALESRTLMPGFWTVRALVDGHRPLLSCWPFVRAQWP
jgi:hypothetical protein